VGVADPSQPFDLAVVGGGMAGLTAAARAARDGAAVVLVERAAELGGSARYAGFLWTAPSDEVLADVDPGGDRSLRHALVAGFPEAVAWARSLGVAVGDEVTILRFGRGRSIDTAAYVAACEKAVGEGPGEILRSATVEELLVDGGAVTGLRVRTVDGGHRDVGATSTLLATGGYQGDRELTATLIHRNAPLMPLRSNAISTGVGLRLARQAGAAFGKQDAGFYGHLVLADVPLDDPMQFANQTLYYSEHALIFNRRGERFIDETLGDHLSAIAAVEQPEARVLVVADQRVRDEWMLGAYVEGITPVDRFDLCRRRGGRYALADTLDDFAYLRDDWGYPGEAIRAEIERFNEAARAGRPLQPGRRFDPLPLDEPPYYVVEAQAAITFTLRRDPRRRPGPSARQRRPADPRTARRRRRRRRVVRSRLRRRTRRRQRVRSALSCDRARRAIRGPRPACRAKRMSPICASCSAVVHRDCHAVSLGAGSVVLRWLRALVGVVVSMLDRRWDASSGGDRDPVAHRPGSDRFGVAFGAG
jgi:FAD binding domain